MKTLHKSLVHDIFMCSFLGAWSAAGNAKPETVAMIIGTYLHKIRADILAGALTLEAFVAEEPNQEAVEIMQRTFANDPNVSETEKVDLERYYAMDYDGVALFMNEDQEDLFKPWIAGTLDMVLHPLDSGWRKGLLQVEDYKTGRIEEVFRPEVVFYLLLTWAYKHTLSIPIDRARFVYFYGRSGRRVVIDYNGSFEDLLHEARQISERCELLLANPVPTPGHHCSWCPLLTTECPLYASLPAVQDPKIGAMLDKFVATRELEPSKAPLVGFALHALDTKTAELKKALRAWVAEHGPVAVGDAEWGLSSTDGDTWDQAAAHAILFSEGVPQEAREIAYGVDKIRVNRLRKSHKALHDRLFKYARLPGKPVERFTFSKRK